MSIANPKHWPSEARVGHIDWTPLESHGGLLDGPIAQILAGAAAERVLDKTLRSRKDATPAERTAMAEALFGISLWRRRLAFHLAKADASPGELLKALRDDIGRLSSQPPPSLAERFSFPDWVAKVLEAEAPSDAWALADALNTPGPVTFRANVSRTTLEGLQTLLAREDVVTRLGAYSPTALVVTSPRPNVLALGPVQSGLCEVQDEGSQLIGQLVEAREGMRILDLCAGAGGKTLQLAAQVGNEGRVLAFDTDLERLQRLERRAARAGLLGRIDIFRSLPKASLAVDAVLVDAPCSELGALRRGPDLRFRLKPESAFAFPALQGSLLDTAAHHVRPGGRIIYATCTFRREENEDVVTSFLARHGRYAIRPPSLPLTLLTPQGFLRTFPHRHGTDGFFGAVLEDLRA